MWDRLWASTWVYIYPWYPVLLVHPFGFSRFGVSWRRSFFAKVYDDHDPYSLWKSDASLKEMKEKKKKGGWFTYMCSDTILSLTLLWYLIFWGINSSIHQYLAILSWSYAGDSASARSSSASFTNEPPSVYTTALRSWSMIKGLGTGIVCRTGSWQMAGGLSRTSGKRVLGSIPTLGNISLWNMIPVFARKHCRSIQRRGIRARL